MTADKENAVKEPIVMPNDIQNPKTEEMIGVIELTDRVMGIGNTIMKSKPRHSLFGLLPDPIPSIDTARVAELARAASGACVLRDVRVQVPPRAQYISR